MENRKIMWINTVLFFVGWTFIMLSGADFPPPTGFYKIVLLILILDFIQFQYLRYFLPRLRQRRKRLFAQNLLFFGMGSVIVAVVLMRTGSSITFAQSLPWIVIVTLMGVIYGGAFWVLNLMLTRRAR